VSAAGRAAVIQRLAAVGPRRPWPPDIAPQPQAGEREGGTPGPMR
jgi:hypothetical protein